MSIYQSINSFCFMFPMGFSTAGSSRVGFFLGRNQPNQARLASKLSIWSSGLASVVLGSILLFTPHTMIPSLFTSDENVLLQTSYTIPLLAFYVVAGMWQNNCDCVVIVLWLCCYHLQDSIIIIIIFNIHSNMTYHIIHIFLTLDISSSLLLFYHDTIIYHIIIVAIVAIIW